MKILKLLKLIFCLHRFEPELTILSGLNVSRCARCGVVKANHAKALDK